MLEQERGRESMWAMPARLIYRGEESGEGVREEEGKGAQPGGGRAGCGWRR